MVDYPLEVCQRKNHFKDRKTAKRKKRKEEKKAGKKLYVYKCYSCLGYHLTSMNRDAYRSIVAREKSS